MKRLIFPNGCSKLKIAIVIVFSSLIGACSSIDPKKVDVTLEETKPAPKITSYTQALLDLGLMTEIYETEELKVQSNPIDDKTGTSQFTGGEIPRDITEMLKSSLNSVGGRVVYIPYDPTFIQNQMVTGYSNFKNKTIPDVILSGGITEFDRGLITREGRTDASLSYEFEGLPDFLPSKEAGFSHGNTDKAGLARITLDFNFLKFDTMTGIPRMNVVNTMEVNKALKEKELGITLFGLNFGRKGSIKKVQGRHAAVRLLVELSMIQMVGKYCALPYWRLLGEDALPDDTVMRATEIYYYRLNDMVRTEKAQEWLFLNGYDVPLNGQLDNATVAALQKFDSSYSPASNIDLNTFIKLYTSIPINNATLKRRNMFKDFVSQQQQSAKMVDAHNQTPSDSNRNAAGTEMEAIPQQLESKHKETETAPRKPGSIGRIITEEEW